MAKQVVKIEYIKQEVPPLPAEPTFYHVYWQFLEGFYCVDEPSAKNLLKDVELMRSYQQDIRGILLELK